LDASYSRKFTDHLSGGLVLRYIYSNLVEDQTSTGEPVPPGRSVAGDIGLYTRVVNNPDRKMPGGHWD